MEEINKNKIKKVQKELKDKTNKNNLEKKENKKINYKIENKLKKEQIKKLEQKIIDLTKQNLELKFENKKNEMEFKDIAKTFQDKAQVQINQIRKETNQKLEIEKEHIKKYGSQKIIESIIEPILNIEQAIISGKKNENVYAYVVGFEMLLNQLYAELESHGVKIINPKIGQEFDPNSHYAISTIQGKQKNKIFKINKKGVQLHDRVLKPATVIINK